MIPTPQTLRRLKTLRALDDLHKHDWDNGRIAKETGVSRRTLGLWASGTTPSPAMTRVICGLRDREVGQPDPSRGATTPSLRLATENA